MFSGVRVTSLTSKRFKNHRQSLVSFLKLVRDLSIVTAITSTQRGKGQSSTSGRCTRSDDRVVNETRLISYIKVNAAFQKLCVQFVQRVC